MADNGQKQNNFLVLSVLASAIIVGGSIIYASARNGRVRDPDGLASVEKTAATALNNNSLIDDDVILGDPSAPVTFVEFGDYQCPFCKKFFNETEMRLRAEYVNTGKVRIVYRDFPLDKLHAFARPAAEAAECARDENKYWAYHDMLFTRQSDLQTMDFVQAAGDLGLNVARFKDCYVSGKYAAEVQNDYDAAIALGGRGTPVSFINSKLVSGAQPYEVFKATIDLFLQSAR